MHFLLATLVAAAPLRILVLDLEPVGVDPPLARSVDAIVVGAASQEPVELISRSDIKKLAELEAARAETGCDTSSCLAELADAMGAQVVLFGSVSKLGDTTTVSLSLFDGASGAVDRDTLTVDTEKDLPRQVPERVRRLVARAVAARSGGPAPPAEMPPLGPVLGIGIIAVGGAGVLAGGAVAAINEAAIQDPAQLGSTKRSAQEAGVGGLIVVAAGALLAAVGGVILVVSGGDA